MKCPYCKKDLKYEYENKDMVSIKRCYYYCKRCDKPFERVTLKNVLGLIKDDTLLELDHDGNSLWWWD